LGDVRGKTLALGLNIHLAQKMARILERVQKAATGPQRAQRWYRRIGKEGWLCLGYSV